MSQAHANGSAPQLDAYGFPVPADEATQAARRRCDDAAQQLQPKWTKLRQLLATGQAREDKVKKYCRRVRPAAFKCKQSAEGDRGDRDTEETAAFVQQMHRAGRALLTS